MRIGSCLFVKDEARNIAEWLAYQHVLGVDVTVVYDNGSSDGTQQVVTAAARRQDVRLVSWPQLHKHAHTRAFHDCVVRLSGEVDWCLFTDADEFLVPRTAATIGELIEPVADAGAIAVNWAMFGSSGHVDPPEGLVIESFTRRAPEGFSPARHVKSILRLDAFVAPENSHCFRVDGRYVHPDGRDVDWEKPGKTRGGPDYAICQVNHYFTRSRAHWAERVRRGFLGRVERIDEEFQAYDRNEVEDLSALRFGPAVRAQLSRYERDAPP